LIKTVVAVALFVASIFATTAASAQLTRFGPIDPTNGFPSWYQDKTGLTLDMCLPADQVETTWCLLPPIPNGPPEVFPTNWAIENFYSDASSTGTSGNTKLSLIMDLENSFANGFNVIPGDQVVFERTRIRISPLPFSGDYTVYTPVGIFTFPAQVAGDKIFFTDDVGLAAAGDFSAALAGPFPQFFLPSVTPGGPELPPMPDLQPGQDPFFDAVAAGGGATPFPNNGRRYIADPGRLGPITGGTTGIAGQAVYTVNDGTTRDPNIFRVEGPNGFVFETNTFSVMGRIFEGAISPTITVNRASYARTANGNTPGGPSINKIDVYATASGATQGRLPAGQASASVAPQLSYFDAPCTATLDAQGNPGPPFSAPVGANQIQMVNSGNNYFGQNAPATIPTQVCIQSNAVNTAGQTVTNFTPANLGDQIFITQAAYDGNNQVMAISATSSDQVVPQTLTVSGFGTIPAGGQLVVNPILAPPATVTVLSTGGGSNTMQMSTGTVNAGAATLPVAVSDSASVFEDCSATPSNVVCASPLNIAVLANDTKAVGGTVTISSNPVLGTAVVNADGSVSYTPNLNAFGTDTFTYNVTVGTQVSNDATVTITITGVNDPPVASNDSSGALLNVQNTINVLANDTDPDGVADLANATIVSGNAALGIADGAVFPGGKVTFTPPSTTAPGTYSFTYQAVDQSGAVSNTATASIIVSSVEAIIPAKAIYTQSKGRWTISGTDSPIAGQTITMTYDSGTYRVNGACTGNAAGIVVGQAQVDPTGNFLFDQILTSTAGVLNPSNTQQNSTGFWCTLPRNIIYSSSLSTATNSLSISLK
jgi:VCBS repeat-containing protein